MNLGESEGEILANFFDIAMSHSSQWTEGSNQMWITMNGQEATIRFYVEGGKLINLNGFIGHAERIIGNLIEFTK